MAAARVSKDVNKRRRGRKQPTNYACQGKDHPNGCLLVKVGTFELDPSLSLSPSLPPLSLSLFHQA